MTSLAQLYQSHKDFDRAEPLYVRALTIRERIYGKRHPQVLESLQDISKLYAQRNLDMWKQNEEQAAAEAPDDETHTPQHTADENVEQDTPEGPSVQVNVNLGSRSRGSESRHVSTKAMPDDNPAFKLDVEEPEHSNASSHPLANALRPSFRPMSIHQAENPRPDNGLGQGVGTLPQSLRNSSIVTSNAEVDDYDFRDAVGSVSVPSHWITRRRIMSVKPWNKLVSLSSLALPRVQLQSQQLCLTLNNARKNS